MRSGTPRACLGSKEPGQCPQRTEHDHQHRATSGSARHSRRRPAVKSLGDRVVVGLQALLDRLKMASIVVADIAPDSLLACGRSRGHRQPASRARSPRASLSPTSRPTFGADADRQISLGAGHDRGITLHGRSRSPGAGLYRQVPGYAVHDALAEGAAGPAVHGRVRQTTPNHHAVRSGAVYGRRSAARCGH